jgi:hypothetical protein
VSPGIVHRSSNAADGVSRYLLVQGIGRYDFVARRLKRRNGAEQPDDLAKHRKDGVSTVRGAGVSVCNHGLISRCWA